MPDAFGSAETPTKLPNYPTAVATPSGSHIFNPFHEGFISQLSHVAVTPGIFSRQRAPRGQNPPAGTPSRTAVSFVWSPEVQGDLFPTEIDENPALQLKLQEILDADNDEMAQNAINDFFQSHLIAPSPDVIPNPSPNLEVQTGISIRPETDLVSLLERAMQLNGEPALAVEDRAHQAGPTSSSSWGLLLAEGTATHIGKAYPHSSLFLCLACQQAHSIQRYRRRSLFVETLDPINDVAGSSSDDCTTYQLSQEPVFRPASHLRIDYPAAQEPLTEEEEAALSLGLPFSWATEASAYGRQTHSSSPPLSPQPPSSSVDAGRAQPERGAADLSSHFDRADITPIKNISMSLTSPPPPPPALSRPFLQFTPISPIAAGRTSPEARAFRLQSMSQIYEEEFQSALEESFRTSPYRQQQRPMDSPQLSPILPSSPDCCGSPPRLLLLSPSKISASFPPSDSTDFRQSVRMDES
ncbi:unnamed protein product [Schistocephalus solidus]|uniref:Protein aurora borealis n=1 Tax=Schistocephalus solidus TaxID=70667 RepID=A0A183T110_SCHSO|nr:unnamed protein product [Schistocephalus solidus]